MVDAEVVDAEVVDLVPPIPANPEVPKPIVIVGKPVISLSLNIEFTTTDLAKLNADQITALFNGIGQVAAIKAVLQP